MSFGSGGFEIDLSSHKISMMKGKSGNGKSTILETLTYCLFGKPYRNIKLAQLINSINGKGLVSTVCFKSNQDEYKVIRGMKPAIFEIYKNGELIPEEAASRDYQKFLENSILGFGYKTFKQICVIGSIAYTQFMALSANDRRVMIEELLDISIFSKMSGFVKDVLTTTKRQIDSIETVVNAKNEELKRLNKLLDDMVESERKKKEEYTGKITSIEAEKIELNKRIDQYNKIAAQLTEKLVDDDSFREQLQEGQSELRSFMEMIQRSKSSIKFFEDTEHCSVCKQEINEDHRKSIILHESNQVAESMKRSKEIYTVLEDVKAKISQFDEFHDALQKANSKLIELQSSLRSSDSMLASLNRELNRENDSEKVITQSRIVADEVMQKMANKISMLEEMDYLNICITMLKDNGIKSKIISTFIPLINEQVNKFLESFDMFVNFELDENFSETIKSRHRDSFTYDSFSNGERARIDISLLLTWREIARRKNSASTNLLIFDETCDSSLDDDAIGAFLDALREQENTNTLIITHRGADPVFFDRSFYVDKKSDGFSRLEELA